MNQVKTSPKVMQSVIFEIATEVANTPREKRKLLESLAETVWADKHENEDPEHTNVSLLRMVLHFIRSNKI